MDSAVKHYRPIMLYHFQEGLTAAETTRKICAVYGPNPLQAPVVRKWFARFKDGNFDIKDRDRSGRPSAVETEQITGLVESTPHLTTRELGRRFGVSHGPSEISHRHETSRTGQSKRCHISTPDLIHHLPLAKNCSSYPGMFCLTHRIVQTLPPQIITYFVLCRILLMGKNLKIRVPSKSTSSSFSLKKRGSFGRRVSSVCPVVGLR